MRTKRTPRAGMAAVVARVRRETGTPSPSPVDVIAWARTLVVFAERDAVIDDAWRSHLKAEGDPNAVDGLGRTPLTAAIIAGASPAVVAGMIVDGADPCLAGDEPSGPTVDPLLCALRHGRTDVARVLLRAGATLAPNAGWWNDQAITSSHKLPSARGRIVGWIMDLTWAPFPEPFPVPRDAADRAWAATQMAIHADQPWFMRIMAALSSDASIGSVDLYPHDETC